MSRRAQAPKRSVIPDPLFKSELLAQFINLLMNDGKKYLAERIVYTALDDVVTQIQADKKYQSLLDEQDEGDDGRGRREGGAQPAQSNVTTEEEDTIRISLSTRKLALSAFKKALSKVTPSVEVKSRRVGSSTYQVPVEIRPTRRATLGMRWLIKYAKQRLEKTMSKRLACEILDAIQERGGAIEKCKDVHRMARANKAFAHYRW